MDNICTQNGVRIVNERVNVVVVVDFVANASQKLQIFITAPPPCTHNPSGATFSDAKFIFFRRKIPHFQTQISFQIKA